MLRNSSEYSAMNRPMDKHHVSQKLSATIGLRWIYTQNSYFGAKVFKLTYLTQFDELEAKKKI